MTRETPTYQMTTAPMTARKLTNILVKVGVARDQIHLKDNWYYVSGFIDFTKEGKGFVYFSTFDHRCNKPIAGYVRKATSMKDYTGGMNRHGLARNLATMVLSCRDAYEPGYAPTANLD